MFASVTASEKGAGQRLGHFNRLIGLVLDPCTVKITRSENAPVLPIIARPGFKRETFEYMYIEQYCSVGQRAHISKVL